MQAFRVGDLRRPIFDGTGALLNGGRWNSPGHAITYAAQTYAGALMEVLVHANLRVMPKYHGVIVIDIPDKLSVEYISMETMTSWGTANLRPHRRFGDRWLAEQRSAILMVPSVVLQGREQNVLINPTHPNFPLIQGSAPTPVFWDPRLFQGR